ncbi:WxL domain-containing protein [Lactiplantibacillus sp. ME-2]|uniref:WxL domain-containing protein n=1 Tax=Lactiplantibacillus sp. ME-2 TaxID=2923377 RepID=UPI002407C85A|nr:WxL domain-containing protein [Lactiplantibacillus sp. ME-2]
MTKSRTLKAAMLVSVASIACLSFNNLGASADTLPSTGKSQADVSFTSNGGSTNPVDPDNPDNPGGGGTGNSGPLSLDAVPTYLNFGTHTQPNVDTAYTLLSKDASQESLATANDDKTQNVTTSGKKNGNDIIYTQVSDSRGDWCWLAIKGTAF